MEQDQNISKIPDPCKFAGSQRELHLLETERISRNNSMIWLMPSLALVLAGVTLFSIGLVPANNRLLFSGLFGIPLSYCLLQYSYYSRQRYAIRLQIQAYHQIEAGGTLKKSAEIGLKQLYEKSHTPPPKLNIFIGLLRHKKNLM